MYIIRNNIKIELTPEEIFQAYEEQQFSFDIADIEQILDEGYESSKYIEGKGWVSEEIDLNSISEEMIEKMAKKMRKYIGNNWTWRDAGELAIREVIQETKQRKEN